MTYRALTALAAAASLALAACGCEHTGQLTFVGGAPPLHAAAVLFAAQQECPRKIAGVIEWREPEATNANHGSCFVPIGSDGKGGRCWWGDCEMSAWVARCEPTPETIAAVQAQEPGGPAEVVLSAQNTKLAHEIGHWCLHSGDEAAVEAWAGRVNAIADALVYGQQP